MAGCHDPSTENTAPAHAPATNALPLAIGALVRLASLENSGPAGTKTPVGVLAPATAEVNANKVALARKPPRAHALLALNVFTGRPAGETPRQSGR